MTHFSINRSFFCLFAGLPSLTMLERLLSVLGREFGFNLPEFMLLVVFALYLLALYTVAPWMIRLLSSNKHVVGILIVGQAGLRRQWAYSSEACWSEKK
jgi:hypothetical protein